MQEDRGLAAVSPVNNNSELILCNTRTSKPLSVGSTHKQTEWIHMYAKACMSEKDDMLSSNAVAHSLRD